MSEETTRGPLGEMVEGDFLRDLVRARAEKMEMENMQGACASVLTRISPCMTTLTITALSDPLSKPMSKIGFHLLAPG